MEREGGARGGESDHHTERAAYYVLHYTLATGVLTACTLLCFSVEAHGSCHGLSWDPPRDPMAAH